MAIFFLKKKKTGIKFIWKCNEYFKIKCHGRVHLSDGKMFKKNIEHNYIPNRTDVDVKKKHSIYLKK